MESKSALVRFCVNKRSKSLVKFSIFSIRRHGCRFDYLSYSDYPMVEDHLECPFIEGYNRMKYVYDILNKMYQRGKFAEKKKMFNKFHIKIEMQYYITLIGNRWQGNWMSLEKEINILNIPHSFFKKGAKYMKDFDVLKKYKILTKYDTVLYHIKLYPNVFNYIYKRSYE